MIDIYIPSFNRAETIKTTIYLDKCKIPYKVILHSENCKRSYLLAGRVKEKDIIVTNQPQGITNQRNWIIKNFAKKGEWYVCLDDNIEGFKRVCDKYYFAYKKLDFNNKLITQKDYDQKIKASEFVSLLIEDIKIAEKIGSEYIGFATVDNYFFNAKKYKPVGYVISKAVAIKFKGICYDKKLEAMEDFGYCAEQIIKNNCVLINSWIKPIAGHYEKGGIGTYKERLPRKIIDCQYLIKKYPGFFRYKLKKGCHPKAELQIRFTKPQQVIEWKKNEKDRSNKG